MAAFQIVAVGTSLGGFRALQTLLGGLPKDFPLPVAIVQHRSHEESEILAPMLSTNTVLPVIEVEDKEEIQAGHVYLCPPNYHLLVEDGHFALSTDAPVMYARPSIDVLFESAAESMGEGVVGVLMTGMSRDGAAGLTRIKECGGIAIVQDPESAEGQMMPRAAISSVAVDRVLPLQEIAPFLVELCASEAQPRI
jgi:two-component system, chemotaxis family, protein-glutamate methylesterase/glutaminase